MRSLIVALLSRLYDGLGAVRQTTGSGPSVQWSGSYQAYGMASSASGSTGNPYKWGAGSGYRSDGFGPTNAAALQKVGARYYDPECGCFLTRDTVLSQRPYLYCDGDPVNFSDPSGHDSVDAKSTNGHAAVYAGLALAGLIVAGLVFTPVEITGGALFGVGLLAFGAGALIAAGMKMIDAGNKQEEQEQQREPPLPNPKGIQSVEQTTWTIYERGPDGSYWPKGTSTTDPGLPPLPSGAKTH